MSAPALSTAESADGLVGDTSVSDDPRVDVPATPSGGIAGEAIPAQGFAVLAARFGREAYWVDVTDRVRPAISDGMLFIRGEKNLYCIGS